MCRLDVRENGRLKVCVRGLLEKKVHDAKSLVQVDVDISCLHGGPAKVRPTYIFDGNISMHM